MAVVTQCQVATFEDINTPAGQDRRRRTLDTLAADGWQVVAAAPVVTHCARHDVYLQRAGNWQRRTPRARSAAGGSG